MKTVLVTVFVLLCVNLHAQQHEVSGRVLDESGKPIAGANVIIKGTSNGVAAGPDGSFRIIVPYGKATFFISFLKYKSLEQVVNINKDFNWTVVATLVRKGWLNQSSAKFIRPDKTTLSK